MAIKSTKSREIWYTLIATSNGYYLWYIDKQSYLKISSGTQSLAKLCCFDIKWCGDIKAIEYCANCMNDIAIDSNLLYTIFQ